MIGEDIKWSKEYEVGVDVIDNAHQELFRIARRLLLLGQDPTKHRWVAEEGLKFLKSYVVRHFTEEEAYMKSIKYPYFDGHHEQHVTLREKVLPRLESRLRHEKFSQEAVDNFLHIIQLWLSRHILVHDVAITRNHGGGAMVAGL